MRQCQEGMCLNLLKVVSDYKGKGKDDSGLGIHHSLILYHLGLQPFLLPRILYHLDSCSGIKMIFSRSFRR